MKNNFIYSEHCSFFLEDEPFRFIGANMYELAHVDSATTELMIEDAAREGFKVIRFWAFEPTSKNKLKEICDIVNEYKIKIIPVLADTWGFLQNYRIEGDWYREGYKKNYIKYVSDIVGSFKEQPEILLWELINEPSTESFEDIYNFTKDASEKIKSIDSNHLLSLGTIGGIGDKFGGFFSRFNSGNFETLYSIKSLDTVSIHDYSFSSTVFERLDIFQRLKGNYKSSELYKSIADAVNFFPGLIDNATLKKFDKTYDFPLTIRKIWKTYNSKNISIAKRLKKTVYIGEIGFKKNLNEFRKIVLENELKRYFKEGVSGILLWSFESQGRSLDGHDYGFGIEDGFGETIKNILISETHKES
ncbi:MAG: cellulase family glycosylhydrolase [Bacteroidota bacterium]|nr:cellulase family glycosylhydrolase [Bacteroidota bacterium]